MDWEAAVGLIMFSLGAIGLLIRNINWQYVKSKIKEFK